MSATTSPRVVEGEADFDLPSAGKPLKTWYSITGNLTPTSVPIIVVHGGPGITSAPYRNLSDLTVKFNVPVIHYDQIGSGKSTHLQEKANAGKEFWNVNLLIAQLESLLHHLKLDIDGRQYDIIAHSYSSSFVTPFAVKKPNGLRKYIIWSGAATSDLWVASQNKLKKTLPEKTQEILRRGDEEGETDTEEYRHARMQYASRFICRLDPVPEDLKEGAKASMEDLTVYRALWGSVEWLPSGALKGYSVVEDLPQVGVPVLLLNGKHDAAQDNCVAPFFERIPKVKWVQFTESSHFANFEERERFMQVVGEFVTA